MMVHQVLSERAQEPKALIRDAVWPEDNPLKENQRHRETIRAPERPAGRKEHRFYQSNYRGNRV